MKAHSAGRARPIAKLHRSRRFSKAPAAPAVPACNCAALGRESAGFFGWEERRRAGETRNSGRLGARVDRLLQRHAATARRPNRFGCDPQEGLLGPEVARRKPRPVVLGLPPAAALVIAALKIS